MAFDTKFKEAFAKLEEFLYKKLIEQKVENVFALKEEITNYLFDTCKDFSLVDKYAVYRAFDSVWDVISIDLKTIQEEGIEAARKTEDVKVYDKKNEEISDKKNENGKIIPFDLIAKVMFGDDFNKLEELNKKLESAIAEFDSYWAELDEDIKEELKKQDDKKESDDVKLDTKVLKKKKEEVYESLENDLIKRYNEYFSLSTNEQIQFEKDHPEMAWPAEEKRTRKGVFKASDFKSIILNVKNTMEIDEEDEDFKVRKLFFLNQNISAIKKERNDCKKVIDIKAVEKLAVLTDDEIRVLLNAKWILPIIEKINIIPFNIVKQLAYKIKRVVKRYENSIVEVEEKVSCSQREIKELIKELKGGAFDVKAIEIMVNLLSGMKDLDYKPLICNEEPDCPQLRFNDFYSKYAKKVLGKIGSTYTGLSGKTKDDFGHGKAQFVTYLNVFKNPIADVDGIDFVEIDATQNVVKSGDVLFTTSSETPEEVGMSSVWLGDKQNTYLNSFCFGYRLFSSEKIDPLYLAYLLRSPGIRKEFQFLAQGISRYNISKTKVMDIVISVPEDYEEQVRIGKLFFNLDKLIELTQKKYEKLENLKKAMLNKMFV